MAMQEQERQSPMPETTRTASDEPQLPGSVTGGSAATVPTSDMTGGGGAGKEEAGPEGSPNNVRSSSPRPVALLSVVGGLKPCSSHIFACPEFQIQRKPRSHVRRAAPSHLWGIELGPIVPPAPGKKKARKKRTAKKLDKPCASSMTEVDVYLLRRTSPRREKSPPPPPPVSQTTEPAPAPGNEIDKPEKWCLHCGITSTPRWRTGPAGESTLCNACGVRYRQGRLVPEYRPRVSPTFNQSEHSCNHREVLKIREKHDHPAPPAAFKPIRTRKRRMGQYAFKRMIIDDDDS